MKIEQKKSISIPPALQLTLALGVGVCFLLAFIYLWTLNRNATAGYEVRNLEKEVKVLTQKNRTATDEFTSKREALLQTLQTSENHKALTPVATLELPGVGPAVAQAR